MAPNKTIPVSKRWIWPFELIEQIGEGGMGVVYRARYVANNREVALKMLPEDVTDKIALARFERELEVLKSLKHPNIVRCFGGVCEDKQRFYAMELVSGGSLEDELQRRGRLSVEQVVTYGLQMCAALEFSHKSGVVHRDIKPSNFLIGNDKQLKLSDFGLASVSAARRITAAGKTAGTLLYMAPEQIRGEEVTPLTDLYALGCVFYELLTGKPPFVGESAAQTMHMHCRAEIPRVSKLVLDCPIELDNLITRLMAKDPAQRPQSAAEVARELRAVTQTITVKIDPKRLLLEGGPSPASVKKSVISQDLGVEDVGPRQRSIVEKYASAALVVMLLGSLTWNLTRQTETGLTRQLETMWIDATREPDRAVRIRAVTNLGELDGQSGPALQAVSKALDDLEPAVRREAAIALGRAGTPSKDYLPALVHAAKEDPDPGVRDFASRSIAQVKAAPVARSSWNWSIVFLLSVVAGVATFLWIRKTAEQAEIPKRKHELGGK